MELLKVWLDDELLFTVKQFDADSIGVEFLYETFKAEDFTLEVIGLKPEYMYESRLEKIMNQLTYGVQVKVEDNRFLVRRSRESGLKPEGKKILQLLGIDQSLLEHNQIWILPLAILFSLILTCSLYFKLKEVEIFGQKLPIPPIAICEEAGRVWEGFKPFIIYGSILAIIVGVAALAYKAIA